MRCRPGAAPAAVGPGLAAEQEMGTGRGGPGAAGRSRPAAAGPEGERRKCRAVCVCVCVCWAGGAYGAGPRPGVRNRPCVGEHLPWCLWSGLFWVAKIVGSVTLQAEQRGGEDRLKAF